MNTENNYRYLTMTPKPEQPALPETAQKIRGEALLGSRKELVIVHNGREYRLRLTQNDKLILTA